MPPRYYSRYGPYSEITPSVLRAGLGAGPALSRLYSSTEYGQADPKRKRQMEEMVAGGFHSGVRPSSIIYGGFNAYGGRDAYAPIPLAWGTWGPMTTGGVSSTGTLEKAGRGLGAVLPRSQRERQLAGVGATPSISMAMAGDPFSFTRFGQMTGMAPQPTASFIPESPSLFDRNQFGSMTGFGGYVPMFPFSNY